MDSQLLSNILYLFGNLFRIYLIYQILKVFLILDNDKRQNIIRGIVYVLFFIINSTGFLYFHWEPLIILMSNIIGILIITMFYSGKWKYRIVAAGTAVVLNLVCEDIAYRLVVGMGVEYLVVVTMAISDILILMATLLLQKYFEFQKGEDVSFFEWLGIVVILGISAFISTFVFDQCNNENAVIVGEICLLLLDTIVFYLLDHLVRLYRIRTGLTALTAQNQAYEKQLSLLIQSEKNLSILRHDMKNHIMVLKQMTDNSRYDQVGSYLDGMFSFIQPKDRFVSTGDPLIDGLVNLKLSEFSGNPSTEIYCDVQVHRANLLDPLDLSILLGNLLDNAVHALRKCSEKKMLDLHIEGKQGLLVISINNSHAEKILERNGTFLTTKRNKEGHGIGLKNVKRIVEKYDGTIDIRYTDSMFSVKLVMFI